MPTMALTVLVHAPNAERLATYAELLPGLLPGARLLFTQTRDEAAAHIHEAEVVFSWKLPADLFAQASRLRWVQAMGAGVEDLVAAPLPKGCLLTRVEGLFGSYMSEYAFLHMLAHAQRLPAIYANAAQKRWAPCTIGKLGGKRLGVAGSGSIGMEVIRKAKAFDMEVWSLVRTARSVTGADRVFTMDQAGEFAAGVDYLVSVLPLTPATIGLIDPLALKQGAVLINMGRGATIDERRLLAAVREGRIEAVLDVFATEPLPEEHPFWSTPGITVTPHLSGPSVPAEVADYFAANFRRFVAAEPLVGLVDRQRGY
ncbi:MAG: putative 2-hydroxyacid dehydrogenase [Symbiobacteriaceae bacterium]|nr:putative 2-hydroxyacid dehydrogenase [Symbiobacteriaceae bacterium]